MAVDYAVIDLFAGPGGLGEGFSVAGRSGDVKMQIKLSVEMEANAVRTLRLRSFLRNFSSGFPQEYYSWLNSNQEMPDWAGLFPEYWGLAQQEVRQLELGAEGVFDEVCEVLDNVRSEYKDNTILIGGPPCQAYSLVGRSRNQGKADYVPENDARHYLYREYTRILNRLNPAAFVMENVKGMLSARVDGGDIFSKVLDDLRSSGGGYTLLPLSTENVGDLFDPPASSFVVRSESHQVPQARHRVIIVGLRNDIAKSADISSPLLDTHQKRVTTKQAISGLSPVRSGLSKGDGDEEWVGSVRSEAQRISESMHVPEEVRKLASQLVNTNDFPLSRVGRESSAHTSEMPARLARWIEDPELKVTLHHETRGHIAEDLGRYLFSSLFSSSSEARSPKLSEFPEFLQPNHKNRLTGHFADRFRTQVWDRPSTTVTSHISKDGHYFIHPDPVQCRSLTVREAARLQTFPDNYFFFGGRTAQYHQVGNAVPPYLAYQIARVVAGLLR